MFRQYPIIQAHLGDNPPITLPRLLKTLYTVFWMLLWGLSFTTCMSIVKFIHPSVPNNMIVFLRCLFGLIFLMPFVMKTLHQEGIQTLKVKRPLLYVYRVILVSCALGCTYYAYRHLPLATASAIGFSGPLFTTLLGVFFLKNKINWQQGVCILIGYLGVLTIIGPFSLTLDNAESIAVVANLLASGAIILLKKLSATESNTRILFYTSLATTILSGISVCFAWQDLNYRDIGLILLIGGSASLSQFFYTQALRLSEPYFVASLEYNRLIFAAVIGYFLFNESLAYSVMIGAGLIILANLYLSFLELKK